MFTPQEVSEKAFPKASFGGYQMQSVDDFLDALTEDYDSLYKENANLKAKLKVLAEKVEEYRATEEAMRSTLLTAQKMAAQMVEDAKAEKEKMLDEARRMAEEQTVVLEKQKEDAQRRLEAAQEELAGFVRHSRDLCAAQEAFLDKLPEMELPSRPDDTASASDSAAGTGSDDAAREASPAEGESTEDTVTSAATAAVQAEKGEDETETGPEQTKDSFDEDFRLDLDDLKFGRNYSGN